MSVLEFNPHKHEYRVDGVVYPGANEVLNCVAVRSKCTGCLEGTTVDGLPCDQCRASGYTSYNSIAGGEFIRDATASRFGTEFHKIARYTLECKECTYDKAFKPYVVGLNKFLVKFGITPVLIEQPLYHPTFRYAGMPDLFGHYIHKKPHDKIFVLVDWKTSVAAQKHWALISAAYAEIIKISLKIKKKIHRLSVMIMPNNYKVIEHKDTGDFNKFLSILNIYKGYRRE